MYIEECHADNFEKWGNLLLFFRFQILQFLLTIILLLHVFYDIYILLYICQVVHILVECTGNTVLAIKAICILYMYWY